MTHMNTSQELSSHKTIPTGLQDQPSESRSGNPETDQFPQRTDELTRLERQGLNDVLRRLGEMIDEVSLARVNANFDRRRQICDGMLKALHIASCAVQIKYPE